jgi:hypothetical protein
VGFNPFGLDAATGGQTGSQPISLNAIDQIQVATAPYDVTIWIYRSFSKRLLNLVQMNFMEQHAFFRNQDLTGSKINGENIFVPSLEQTSWI